ncbi:MAG: fatty acid--CoA ligase [Desulfatibacillum sp.]|nr:fatty acid--CoA ligase [Desulfatibacillum sp.]
MPVRMIQQSPSAYGYPLLIKQLIANIYEPDQEIVYRDKMTYTYKDMVKRIQKLANSLEGLGIEQGSTVAVMDWDSHRYLECFFAVPMMGAVLHTINIRLSPEQLVYTVNHAEDDIILIHKDFLPLVEAVKDQLATVKQFILIEDFEVAPPTTLEFAGEYEQLLAGASDQYEWPDFDENAMATTFYTTGTTGLPKGVYFSHRQIFLHTLGILNAMNSFRAQLKVDSGDVYMPLTPMFHVHAWGLPYAMTMIGAKQVYPGRYEPETILKLARDHKATYSHCVPTILHMLLNSPSAKDTNFEGWKITIGGAALPKGMCIEGLKMGINIYSAYGMSETCPLMTQALLKPYMLDWPLEQQVDYRTKTGLPAPCVQVRIVDPEGKELPHDGKTAGEVVTRAPWLTQGYLNNPEKSEELWENGWLHTGDVGIIDELGYLQITDRIKDVIKTGGEWLSSLELESIISQHKGVSEVAVVGIKDDRWGERPMALIVPRAGEQLTVKEIQTFMGAFVENGTIPKYGIPESILFVDEIPKTSVGKIDKKEIRAQQG